MEQLDLQVVPRWYISYTDSSLSTKVLIIINQTTIAIT